MNREQLSEISTDLSKKMVLLSGPRQVGKSWLSKQLLASFEGSQYYNYDVLDHRRVLESQAWPKSARLLVFDELHKMPGWKNWLKGVYDGRRDGCSILVTGSARLETFRQAGDSLAGRYFHHRLLPFTPSELKNVGEKSELKTLIERGGFPEPYLAQSESDAGRWRRQYLDGLIRDDILQFENIGQLRAMTLLVELLRQRVSSPLSYQGLAEDLSVSPHTVKRYIDILEALYIVFRVYPWHRSIARSLVQQPKVYFYDCGLVEGDTGARFENLVALSLHKELCLREDRDGIPRRLCYLRTKDGREVDFAHVKKDEAMLMVEAKLSDSEISKNLRWFHDHTSIKGVQVVANLDTEYHTDDLSVRNALGWLENISEA